MFFVIVLLYYYYCALIGIITDTPLFYFSLFSIIVCIRSIDPCAPPTQLMCGHFNIIYYTCSGIFFCFIVFPAFHSILFYTISTGFVPFHYSVICSVHISDLPAQPSCRLNLVLHIKKAQGEKCSIFLRFCDALLD